MKAISLRSLRGSYAHDTHTHTHYCDDDVGADEPLLLCRSFALIVIAIAVLLPALEFPILAHALTALPFEKRCR